MILDCDEVIDGRLWVGGYIRPEEVRYLERMGITYVLNLQSDRDMEYYDIPYNELLKAYNTARIEIHRFPVQDFDKKALASSLPEIIIELEKVMADPQTKVYSHCTAGVNRSPTVAAAYLIKTLGFSAQESYDLLIARRNCNPYLDVLQSYESSLRDTPSPQS